MLHVIARIESDFREKFGIPRQSGMINALEGTIVFEEAYRNPDALRGIEGFSHLWLIWGFSQVSQTKWSPTVRPPRLGGNARMGVFATRSPYRPNPIGLSCVKLIGALKTEDKGTVLRVSGADLMDGTPIYDIKPYLPYTDCIAEATQGFVENHTQRMLKVDVPEALLCAIPENKREALIAVLAQDPRPSYQDDPERLYGMAFAGFNVKFRIAEGLLTVEKIEAPSQPPA